MEWASLAWTAIALGSGARKRASSRRGQDEEQRSWQTRLNLQLPELGGLSIVAVLRNGEFALRFEASAQTAEKIRAETKNLQNRFEAAGLTLASSLVVVNAEQVNVT
ncbi:flagellar hook-length control protein FliK [Iodobacter fluviatilis]|uniref:Flagellar hook-length control protein-like C-terminal domain-containing protein n=1 Tax=Iodobacter fluviatilis TaxID=537 RepID=A0A7G3GCH8_9NEIS|nr:flagellar hook-length control protein FliK [Iodobacter fluviatilis]QBC45011.1 hypothetical protein C1H71_16695 [Iodobacter fluviatilis]